MSSIQEMIVTGPDEQAVRVIGTVKLTWYYRGDPASTTSEFYVTEELPERYEFVLGKEAADNLNREKELRLLPFGMRPGETDGELPLCRHPPSYCSALVKVTINS